MRKGFLGWPGWRHLTWAVLVGGVLAAWWMLIYAGADWITAQRTYRVRVHLDVELGMPFVPAFVLAYHSIYGLYCLAPFVLRQRRVLGSFFLTHAVVMLVAGVCFLLFPAELAYPSMPEAGAWEEAMVLTRKIALTYNLAPSLHVALAIVCVSIYSPRAGAPGKSLLWAWGSAVALSTLLTHQHHVVDVVTGWALALAGKRFVFDRWADEREV
jgi:hypothetical protein